ncbi:MAG: hypothetical protein JW832_06505 [Deltaproteobacteria bacterium]|nr:hypothetical protein [Deltaproteobacteria bacterium]
MAHRSSDIQYKTASGLVYKNTLGAQFRKVVNKAGERPAFSPNPAGNRIAIFLHGALLLQEGVEVRFSRAGPQG